MPRPPELEKLKAMPPPPSAGLPCGPYANRSEAGSTPSAAPRICRSWPRPAAKRARCSSAMNRSARATSSGESSARSGPGAASRSTATTSASPGAGTGRDRSRGQSGSIAAVVECRAVRVILPVLVLAAGCGGAAVPERPVASVVIDGAQGGPLTSIGEERQLMARPLDAAGRAVAARVTWVSSNPRAVAIDADGLATAAGNGDASVGAFAGGALGSVLLSVRQSAAALVVEPARAAIEVGEIAAFSVRASDPRGNPADVSGLRWSSGDPAIASIDSRGLATGKAPGVTVVSAAAEGRAASAELRVVPAKVASVRIEPASATALASLGDTLQLTAVALDARGGPLSGFAFTWSSSDGAVAAVDGAGLVTAKANGNAVVSASTEGKSGEIAIAVRQVVRAVDVAPPEVTLRPGRTQAFTAAALDGRGNAVAGAPPPVWSSSDETVVKVAADGVATAQAVTAASAASVFARIGGAVGSAQMTVDPAAPDIATIEVSGAGTLHSLGETLALTATARDALGAELPGVAFTWSSDAPAVATVSPAGVVTAVANGTAPIRARAGGKDGTADVVVAQVVASVSVATHAPGASTTLASLGDTLQLDGKALDARGNAVAGAALGWTSSDGAVATVSAAGLVSAARNGTARVTARAASLAEGFLDVTVQQVVASVAVTSPAAPLLASLGEALQLAAAGKDARGNTVAAATSFAWRSDDAAVVSVDSTGLALAKKNGSTLLRAKFTGNDVEGALLVTVAQAAVSVEVSAASSGTPSLGAFVDLAAVAKDAGGSAVPGVGFAWSAETAGVVTLVPTADTAGCRATAVANGTTKVHAKTAANVDGFKELTVAQVATQIAVLAPGGSQLGSYGASLTVTAVARDANGNPAPAPSSFTWSADDPTIVDVAAAPDGASATVTAKKNGSTLVHATAPGLDGPLGVTVRQVAATVTVSAGGASTTLTSLGETLPLTATARDANANVIDDAAFTWSSDDEAKATVGMSSGVVTAVANGSTTIRAHADSIDGPLGVTVAQAVASIAVTPDPAVVTSGKTRSLFASAKDGRNNPMSGVTFSWLSASSSLTVNSSSGVISGTTTFGTGPVEVSASAESKSGVTQAFVAVYAPWTFGSAAPANNQQIRVNQGQWVVLQNDGSPHTLISDTGLFSSDFMSGGVDSQPMQFTLAPGSYPVHCGVHGAAAMKGTLIVQ